MKLDMPMVVLRYCKNPSFTSGLTFLTMTIFSRLSGGAYLGYYHMGVLRALFEEGLMPRVLSGASAGSIMVGVVG